MFRWFLTLAAVLGLSLAAFTQTPAPPSRFRVLVLTEAGGQHGPFVDAAQIWLKQLSKEQRFDLDTIQNTDAINDTFLTKYQLIIQLNYPPYAWKETAMAAFKSYIEKAKGGWIGFHHATLLGEFDGYPLWPWFSDFMGGIKFDNYIPTFAAGTVHVEDGAHPCMKDIPSTFIISKEEWYTYNRSPRPNVHVLASVDESTYSPVSTVRMGDHPVVWTNEKMAARNVYIFMGHGADLFENKAYTTLFRNAVLWAAGR